MTGNGRSLCLGFDAGSVALKTVVVDAAGSVVEQTYTRTQGRPVETAVRVFQEIIEKHGAVFDLVAGTGSAGRMLCELLGVPFVNEVISQATAVRKLHPEVVSVIEMGGQDSKLIYLPDPGTNGRPMVDFAMNTSCAAGTGSFLDQQASRLGVPIEVEFGKLALLSKNPPRVAGRCSVFAKSDMIHLQQQAAPVHDIVAGLCMGLARNLKTNLSRATELKKPIAFCGGVAANAGVVHAIREVFELHNGDLIVPELYACTGAFGAVMVSLKERLRHGAEYGRFPGGRLDTSPLESHLRQPQSLGHRIAPLEMPAEGRGSEVLSRQDLEARVARSGGPIDAWLGLDVGSISTKMAVIDAENRVLAKVYLMTAGRPLDAVRKVLADVGQQVNGLVRIRGAATTGSGRYLTADVIGADLVINEITAQATAAAAIDPTVDTIFEIGGQDSKYISLDDGVVVDFEMNHACAAGTGSFLEEQAERLGISIKKEFGELALASRAPIQLGERCTVFMESDLLSHQQQGARTEDLVAGLSYSIVSNYINRVVGHRRIGGRIFFQGGTAFNVGVVAAFQKFTGRQITVPPHHEVTGAIGAAVLARRHQEKAGRDLSNFGGFAAAEQAHSIRSFECEHCSNLCEINEVSLPGRDPLYYGSRCDRYNAKKDRQNSDDIPNLFAERQKLLIQHANLKKTPQPGRPSIGIPLALSSYQLLPLWGTLLGELGFNVSISGASTQEVIRRGVAAVTSTPCFPVKVAHGHVLELIDRGVDYVWLPSVISMKQEYAENEHNWVCPYVQTLPYQVTAAIELNGKHTKLLKLPIRFQEGPDGLYQSLKPMCDDMGIGRKQLKQAVAAAMKSQGEFEEACRARGREVLAGLGDRRAVVVMSRAYNGCDIGVCLNMPAKLRKLNVLPIPMDFLDLRDRGPTGDRVFSNMFWKYGQSILHAAEIVRDDERLHAVFLSNFSCGPDSFILNFFKRVMAPKPSLVIEIDEHSADAGVVTRLEAFIESLNHAPARKLSRRLPIYPASAPRQGGKRMLYLPWMGDVSYAMAAVFRGHGQPSEVMPPADAASVELGRRFCTGKECLPCIITAGDMVKVTRKPGFDPDRTAFMMPGSDGPCRFGQYNSMHKMILNELGFPQVPIVSPSQDQDLYNDFGRLEGNPTRMCWCSIISVELLSRTRLAIRPYEVTRGDTDAVYQQALDEVCRLLEKTPTDAQLAEQMALAAERFAAIRTDRSQTRPRIGVVGEMYVRRHAGANNDLVAQLEQLGAEVDVASFAEWIYYLNWCRQHEAGREKKLRLWLRNFLENHVQHRIERRLGKPFKKLLGHVAEPSTAMLLKLAEPFIDPSFQGESVLSVGRMIEMAQSGFHGVINVMPFGCMPSTVVAGVMKRVTSAMGQVPALSISYDGQQDPMLHTRLEAFVYQARVFQKMGAGHDCHAEAAHAG